MFRESKAEIPFVIDATEKKSLSKSTCFSVGEINRLSVRFRLICDARGEVAKEIFLQQPELCFNPILGLAFDYFLDEQRKLFNSTANKNMILMASSASAEAGIRKNFLRDVIALAAFRKIKSSKADNHNLDDPANIQHDENSAEEVINTNFGLNFSQFTKLLSLFSANTSIDIKYSSNFFCNMHDYLFNSISFISIL